MACFTSATAIVEFDQAVCPSCASFITPFDLPFLIQSITIPPKIYNYVAENDNQQTQQKIPYLDEEKENKEEEKDEFENETVHGGFDEEEEVDDNKHNHPTEEQHPDNKIEEQEIPEEDEKDLVPVQEGKISKTHHFHDGKDNRCRGDDSTQCPGSNVFICSDQLCDGTTDCPNGADETHCDTEEPKSV